MKVLWFRAEEGGMSDGVINPTAEETRQLFDQMHVRQHTRNAVRWVTSSVRKVGQYHQFGNMVLVTVL